MKKLFVISILAIISFGVNAQSQRLVLAEEFTNASCIYCGNINPSFDLLLAANSTKITALKYHVYWPAVGVDPMSTQTQTWVNPRITLDTVNAIPLAFMDGGYPSMIGLTYLGYPGNFSQHVIDSVYAIPSPFAMNLSYSFTPAYDSVNVRCVFTCTQAITMSIPKLQVAMTEKHIHFATAPGTDGETDFYDVMRCMYPNGNGTALNTTWAIGDKDSLIFSAKIPSYIYDKGEIAFVAFIQDNAGAPTCNVKQAAYCAPQVITGENEIAGTFNHMNIYPNPTIDNLTIETPQSAVIEITNINGQLIETHATTGNKTNIDVSSFLCGVYIVEVKTEKGIEVKKFVKE